MNFASKYVSENRYFEINWTIPLTTANNGNPDTLATSLWQAETGITIITSSISGNRAIVRVSGGVGGQMYRLENTVTLTTSAYTRIDYLMIKVNYDPVSP